MSAVCHSAMLRPAKKQDSEENAGSRAAGEKTKSEQVNLTAHLRQVFECIELCVKLSTRNWNKLNINYRYIPDVTGALYDVLKVMAQSHASKKKRFEAEDAELLGKVSARLVTKETLMEKLAQHVEQVTMELKLLAINLYLQLVTCTLFTLLLATNLRDTIYLTSKVLFFLYY